VELFTSAGKEMMIDRFMRRTALTLTAALLAACNEDMTAPETDTPSAAPVASELAALSGSWTTKADIPDDPHIDVTTAMLPTSGGQSSLYVIGGRSSGSGVSSVRMYQVGRNSWIRRAEYPIRVYSTNGAGVVNGKIYVSGGLTEFHTTRHELYMYDPATNVWTRKRDMPDYTWGGITGVINNKLYVLTCTMQDDCYTVNAPLNLYRYDPATDQWTDLGLSPAQHRPPMGGTIGGKLYFTGRSDAGAALLTVYDPGTNQWTSRTPMNNARFDGAAATLGAKLYILGGWEQHDGNNVHVRTVNVYNPASDSWTKAAPMPTDRTGYSAERVVLDGKPRIEVVGGAKPGNNQQFTP
jgi:N-acetylneuraminic acid mutarotase